MMKLKTKMKTSNEQICREIEDNLRVLQKHGLPSFVDLLRLQKHWRKLKNGLGNWKLYRRRRLVLQKDLQKIARAAQQVQLFLYPQNDLPNWLKRGSKSAEQFYADFFVQLERAPALLRAKTSALLDAPWENYRELAVQWKSLRKREQNYAQRAPIQMRAVWKFARVIRSMIL